MPGKLVYNLRLPQAIGTCGHSMSGNNAPFLPWHLEGTRPSLVHSRILSQGARLI